MRKLTTALSVIATSLIISLTAFGQMLTPKQQEEAVGALITAVDQKLYTVSRRSEIDRSSSLGCSTRVTGSCLKGYTTLITIADNPLFSRKDIRYITIGDESSIFAQSAGYETPERTIYDVSLSALLSADEMIRYINTNVPDRDLRKEAQVKVEHAKYYAETQALIAKVNADLKDAGVTVGCLYNGYEHNPNCKNGVQNIAYIAKSPLLRGKAFTEILISDHMFERLSIGEGSRRWVVVNGEAGSTAILDFLSSFPARTEFESELSRLKTSIDQHSVSIIAKLKNTYLSFDEKPGYFADIKEYRAYALGVAELNQIAHLPQIRNISRRMQIAVNSSPGHNFNFDIHSKRYVSIGPGLGATAHLNYISGLAK